MESISEKIRYSLFYGIRDKTPRRVVHRKASHATEIMISAGAASAAQLWKL